MEKKILSLNLEDIECETKIGEGRNCVSFLSINKADSSKCVAKFVKDIDNEQKFIDYINAIQEIIHPGIIPFIGFCKSSENNQNKNVIILKFAENYSLQHIFDLRNRGQTPEWWTIERQYLFIYGIAQTMNYLHSIPKFHSFLTPSNILINENFEPQISDFSQYIFSPEFEYTPENIDKYNLTNYIDSYILNGERNKNQESDIFSFAIITLQILSGNDKIYDDYDDIEEFLLSIKNGIMPNFPCNIPYQLHQLLESCLSLDIKSRPQFPEICQKLDEIIESIDEISKDIFNEYKDKITQHNIEEEINPKINKMKKEGLSGDTEKMYLYAKARLEGINCKKNTTEAIDFFRMAANKGHSLAKEQLSILTHNIKPISSSESKFPFIKEDESEDESDDEVTSRDMNAETNDSYVKKNFLSLVDDTFFDEPKWNIESLLKDVDKQIKIDDKINFYKEDVKKQNFIFTEGAEERLQKLYDYIKVGVPVLLEGPTGTSKTLSSEIVCKLLDREMIRFNLSSETKTQDLIGRYVGDENSWAGISQKDGPFYQAFKEGKVLLLDEINLASASVLQCIEESLDSGVLSIEIPGRPLKNVKMNPDFRVIATQNPNKGSYANKRQNLGLKFYSRFQIINFPAFTENELLEIAKGLASQFDFNDMAVINQLVSFHKEWSENPAIVDDPQCFTIREIAATVKALSQKEEINDTIMTIYGARYQKILKDKLNEVLNKYPLLKKGSKKFEIPEFPNCYKNKSLISTVKSTLFSLHNGRNVILTGKEGCGKTQVAIWIADYYNKEISYDDKHQKSFFCVCTEEIKVSDLIGHQAPSGKSDGTSELIKWQDGFLTKAIIQGKCSVLESLDEAPSTVTERLNGLLDQKYDGQKKYFDIPENSAHPKVLIEDSFRILATSNIDKISQMSPAFLNRFDIIVIENQIDESITENQFHELINILLKRYSSEIIPKQEMHEVEPRIEDETENDNEIENDDEFEISINGDDDDEISDENENNGNANIYFQYNNAQIYNFSSSFIPKIYNKIKNERNISHISKICNAVIKLSYILQRDDNKRIDENQIVDFAFKLLQNNQQFDIPHEIEKSLKNMFTENLNSTDDPFFYKDSPSLCNFLSKLMAYSIISQPICITGPTGVGKTSAARAFSRMRPHSSRNKACFQMHSFHSGTKVSHFFGSTTLNDGKIYFHDGTLTTALKTGAVFIADEFNLSTQSVMKSLSMALDQTIGKNVFVPGTGEIINISPEFHFIACQNEIGTLGRNVIPDSIASRFVYIDYPTPDKDDIEKICISISKENFITSEKPFKDEDEELAKNIADYMIRLKESKIPYIPQWSLRDITKLFRRIYTQDEYKKFINIKPIHHVLFYTMSAVSQKDVKNVINEIQKILQLSFNLDDDEVSKYFDCYQATPEIREIEGYGFCMMKGDSGISIHSMSSNINNIALPSLCNAIFHIYLSNDKEPILLMGNSGFKTFLAEQFLLKTQPITLNQETNVAQLLGSSSFMTYSEAKIFYIEYICKIVRAENEYIRLRESWEKGELTQEQINEIVNDGLASDIPASFHYALKHLAKKLMNDDQDKNCVLSNTILEFRPGLFLNAILQGQSLILKDLSNLPTIVLERFNELFSGKQNITLSEDIHNTFTPADDKELTKLNDSFRVFATCPENSPSKLSEAVLSRFTVISVPEYTIEEQEKVLISYIQIKKLNFEMQDINRLNQFSLAYNLNLKIHMSFPQMIKTVDMTSKLNHESLTLINENLNSSMNTLKIAQNDIVLGIQKQNIRIALFRVLGGLLDSKNKKEILIKNISDYFGSIDFTDDQKEVCQLVVTSKNGISGVLSNISNHFLKRSSAHECKTKVAFTKSFNDLLDLLHMGLTIHYPIIFEGSPGQGKHTAINYIAEMLNLNVIHIIISQTTKYEDLFGKIQISRDNDGIHVKMIETQFVKAIKSAGSFDERSLIVLENINYASPALLNALVQVFNINTTSILLPNGSTIDKGKFDIVGIFNTQQTSSSKDKLPSTIINSSIYHIVPRPNKKDILSIILTKFSLAGLSNEEAEKFNSYYTKAMKCISTNGSSGLFTLNDIEKYILFRKLTKDVFHETTISQMIFAYRFSSDEMIQKMLKNLNLENMIFTPLFDYDVPPSNLFVRLSSEHNDGLLIPLSSPPKNNNILSSLSSLTLPQKQCLIFLGCSLLSKRSCVIQGDTASGKSHLIRLFAKLLGAKLNVFQMNSDSNISMLAGQSVLNNSISKKDQENFKKAFSKLCIDKDIKKYLDNHKNLDISNYKTWNPKKLKKLLEYIKTLETNIRCTSYHSEIENAVQLIKDTMNPVNRFTHQESAFIHAIRKGEWVLIDGIESAPSAIAEKISTLCGSKPELNLYEYGPEFYFSKDNNVPLENKIHDNFHLFITYNPNCMKESQMIDQTFLVKSVTFTLPSIDERIENSAQMLLGSFIGLSLPKDVSRELASRFAAMHSFAKAESRKNPDDFAGDIQYNGRTLKFLMKSFSQKEAEPDSLDLSKSISFSTRSFYWNSYINEKELPNFQLKCLEKFKEQPKEELIINLQVNDMNPRERNEQVLLTLRNIQKHVLGKKPVSSYSLANFLELCFLIHISDLAFIQSHLLDTIRIIEYKSNDADEKNMPSITYGTLYALSLLFEPIIKPIVPIKKEHTFLSLKDEELKNNKSIASELFKIDLLRELLQENLFSEDSSILLGNKSYLEIISKISIITSNFKKDLIIDLFRQIQIDNSIINFVDKVFPYLKFKDTQYSMISYWIPLTKFLISNGIHFLFSINNQFIEFNSSSTLDFFVKLNMNDPNNFSITTGELFHNQKALNRVKEHPENHNKKYDLFIYWLILQYSERISDLSDKQYVNSLQTKVKSVYKNKQITNLSINSILSLKDLFNAKDISLISAIWNIIYTLHENVIFELSQIIHPIEADLLISAYNMFTHADQNIFKNIISWSKWASSFENAAKILWKIILQTQINQKPSEIDAMIEHINDVIEYLRKSPELMNEYWCSDKYINICQTELTRLKEKKVQNEIDRRALIIQTKIEKLKNDLVNQKVNDKYKTMKAELVNHLGNVNEFTDDKYIFLKDIIQQFIKDATSKYEDENNSGINWPQYNGQTYNNQNQSENIKLFEALIWYSQIKSILVEINNEKDIINNLHKLHNFPEMECPRDIIFTNLMKNAKVDKQGITDKDKKQALFTLNAHMILKLYNINHSFISDSEKITRTINKYIERNSSDDREIQWIYQKLASFQPDFSLTIPKFNKNDLVFLLVNKKSHSIYQSGPLLHGISELTFFKNLKVLMHSDFESFTNAAKSIGKVAYRFLTPSDENEPNDYDELKNFFTSYKNPSKLEIAQKIKKIFEFAECLEKWNCHELRFDDISFLNDKLFLDNQLLNQFPSLLFWLCKNKQCGNQIIKKYQDYSIKDNEIPLWLLAIRILSSMDCISFDFNSNPTSISQIIEKTTSKLVKKYITDNKGKNLNYDWMSIMLSNLPLSILNSSISIIHDFFISLSLDNQTLPLSINEKKNQFIEKSIGEVTTKILSNESQQLMTENIENKNSIIYFLAFPSEYVKDKIKDSASKNIDIIFNDESTNKLRNFLNNSNNLDNIISNLQNAVDEDEEEMKKYHETKIKQDYEKRKKSKINEIKNLINDYNKIINLFLAENKDQNEKNLDTIDANKEVKNDDKIAEDINKIKKLENDENISKNLTYETINEKIQQIKSIKEKLNIYPDLFLNDGIEIAYIKYFAWKDVEITVRDKNNIPKILKLKGSIYNFNQVKSYLLPGEKYVKNDNTFYSKNITPGSYKILFINNDYNFDKIIISTNIARIPKIFFGNIQIINSIYFISDVNKLDQLLKSLEQNCFINKNPKQIFDSQSFECINEIDDLLDKIKSNNMAKFSDSTLTKKTQVVLQNLGELLDYLSPLIKNIRKLTNNLYTFWKTLKESEHFQLFRYQYDVQIPKENSFSRRAFDFSKVENIDLLASPIISVSPENKIICSVKKLKCHIGPIFPSNISNPFSVNIISFINGDITYKICNLSDPQFNKILTIKDKPSCNEPIQILIAPPPALKCEPEIINMKGDIVIKSKSSQSLSLPFEIALGIVPLKLRIQCLNYKLSEQDKNLILCCDKIITGGKIDFEIKNYYIRDHFIIAIELEPLDENKASKPTVIISKLQQTFSIQIPEVSDPTRCKFIIKIAFSQNLVISVFCDFIILPFIFTFEIYSYLLKEFVSNCDLVYLPNVEHNLVFRIMTLFPSEQACRLYVKMPDYVFINSDNKEFQNKFIIRGDYVINGNIKFNEIQYYSPYNSTHFVSLAIRNITKKISIKFIDPSSFTFNPFKIPYERQNNEFIKKFPCIEYNYDINNWIKIKDIKKLKSSANFPYFICTPFKYYTNIDQFTIINYNHKKEYVCSSKTTGITYMQMTLTIKEDMLFSYAQNDSTKKMIETPSNKPFKSYYYYYYSVIGYLTNNEENWFPAFKEYPTIENIALIAYSTNYKNKTQAEQNIKKMYQSLDQKGKLKLDDVKHYFHSNTKIPVKKTNFAIFMMLLNQNVINNNISKFIEKFPHDIQNLFTDFIQDLNNFLETTNTPINEITSIISHNLILKFAQIFQAKYNQLKSHQFCLECIFSISEIKDAINTVQKQLFNFDKSQIKKRSKITTYEFNEKEKIMEKISLDSLPELSKRYDCFIISENEPLKSCEKADPLGSFSFDDDDKDETVISDDMNSLASLPLIDIPKENTIENLNAFYSSCAQGATALPAYIRLCQIQSKGQNESEKYFAKLLAIYQDITIRQIKNHSILANHINSFIESFQNCVRRLKRAGINIPNSVLPTNLKDSNNFQDFIKFPESDTPVLRKCEWKVQKQQTNEYTNYVDPLNNIMKFGLVDPSITNSIDNSLKYTKEEDQHNPIENINIDHNEIGYEEKQLIIAQIINDKNLDDDEKEDKDFSDDDDKQIANNKPTLKLVENSKIETVNTEDINGIFPEFTELDSIKRVLRRIKEMRQDEHLKFLDSNECQIQNQNDLFSSNASSFPVHYLVILSQNLIANLIAKASDTNIPFLDISCNLLIDCSSFICLQNKLYNFMVVVAYSYALSALEIPFSIAIVADLRFRFVLKPFEEEISILVLQRILDCLFIKRYKTNIADTFRHCLEYMKCPDDRRSQRALFFFSDGLDENLVLAQSWKETLLNNENNSFGMIFIKSKFFDNEKFSDIQQMWDSFNEVAKTASSITKLIYINPDLNALTIESIVTTFCHVLSRQQTSFNHDFKNKVDAKPEFKQSYPNLSKDMFDNIKLTLRDNFDEDSSSSIFRKINQRFTASGTRFPKLEVCYYRNKTEKITNSSPHQSIKEEFDQLIRKIIYSKRNSFIPLLETIFKPNKASQTVLSNTGTDFDITALILNLINPVPDPLIYLEEKGGLVRNYGISIIIDSSRSCFNNLSSSHSYQTMKVLFAALSSIDIPCVDVIIATDDTPIVLASELPSLRLFSDKSSFWPSLFNCLSNASFKSCSLEAGIHAAYDIRRMRSVDSASYMFVLTDGLFQQEQKEIIQNHVMTCIQSGITIFGIGIGIYPSGITDLFPQVIFATNPNDLIKGIASCFNDELNESYENTIKQLAPEPSSSSAISKEFEILIQNENNPIFKDLKNYLSEITHAMDAFTDMYNEEQEERNADNELVNPKGMNTEMYVKDILESQKILIVMLYDSKLNLKENAVVSPEFLFKPEHAGEDACVKKAVEHFGIEIVVVGNYKDAIKELTKQTIPNKCSYYAVWVISGLPYDMKLPDGGNQHLVDQFIDCLIQFWQNGGSIVLFAESDPLTFQANRFLEKVTFPDGSKTNLRLHNNHQGMKYLKGDPSGLLNKPGTFNKSPLEFKKCQRASLAHNLVEIYEGETISYAPNDKSLYKPFIPFMRDSENGISALFYAGDKDPRHRTGDIIVDCGYTKLFDKMTTNGTFRYVQNIAGWTAQCESRRVMGFKPKDFRPEAVHFQINENAKCDLIKLPDSLLQKKNTLNISSLRRLFAIDYSGSVGGVSLYHNNLADIFNNFYKPGDTIMTWSNEAFVIDYNTMRDIYTNKKGTKGTCPSSILKKLIEDTSIPREHLILVTDGHINSGDVQLCDQIVQRNNIKFSFVTTYIIGSGGDRSVGAPFCRSCGSKRIEITSTSRTETSDAKMEDFSALDSIESIKSVSTFNMKFESLKNATIQKTIGTKDLQLKIKYSNLLDSLKKSGNVDRETKRRIEMLIGLCNGDIENVFDNEAIVAKVNS